MAKRRKKITFDLKEEIKKIEFPELVTDEISGRYGNKTIQVLDRGYKYSWNRAERSYYRSRQNQQTKKTAVVTAFSFENRSNGMRITMSNINSGGYGGYTFIIKKWEEGRVLANLVCAMQVLSSPAIDENGSSMYQPSLDRTRRTAMARAFMANKEKLVLPQYLTELLKHLELVIEHEAVLGREKVKEGVTDAFKILMGYGYDETDVLCLWREIVAEQIVAS